MAWHGIAFCLSLLRYDESLQEGKVVFVGSENSRGETIEVLGERGYRSIDWRIRFMS